jgi:hypothetical protein
MAINYTLHFKILAKAYSWTTLEEDFILTWGQVLKPAKVSVLLSYSFKTCSIQLVHFGVDNKKAM